MKEDTPEDKAIQKEIILRVNRSLLIMNIVLRRRTGRPIGQHIDLRPSDLQEQLAKIR